MPHLQSTPEPHSDTKTRPKADGAPFKSATAEQGTPNDVRAAPLQITFNCSGVDMGKRLRYFLRGVVTGLLTILLESRENLAFVANFSCKLESRGAWVAPLVERPTLDFCSGLNVTAREFKPCLGLCADSTEAAWDSLPLSLSLSLSVPPPLSLSHSLSQNK